MEPEPQDDRHDRPDPRRRADDPRGSAAGATGRCADGPPPRRPLGWNPNHRTIAMTDLTLDAAQTILAAALKARPGAALTARRRGARWDGTRTTGRSP